MADPSRPSGRSRRRTSPRCRPRSARSPRERDAIILAHNYQVPEVQDVADYVGDSLGALPARRARSRGRDRLLRRALHGRDGVDPLPGQDGAASRTSTRAARWPTRSPPSSCAPGRRSTPGAITVMYVNTTAEIKALTDYCCTSSNAVQVVEHILREHGEDTEILFGPDMFLGAYVEKSIGRAHARLGRRVPRPRRHPPRGHRRACAARTPARTSSSTPSAAARRRSWSTWPPATSTPTACTCSRRAGCSSTRERRRRRARRRSWRPRPGCSTRCAWRRPTSTSSPPTRRATCRYMKMITLPKLRDALRDLQRRGQGARGRRRSAPGCRSSAWSPSGDDDLRGRHARPRGRPPGRPGLGRGAAGRAVRPRRRGRRAGRARGGRRARARAARAAPGPRRGGADPARTRGRGPGAPRRGGRPGRPRSAPRAGTAATPGGRATRLRAGPARPARPSTPPRSRARRPGAVLRGLRDVAARLGRPRPGSSPTPRRCCTGTGATRHCGRCGAATERRRGRASCAPARAAGCTTTRAPTPS